MGAMYFMIIMSVYAVICNNLLCSIKVLLVELNLSFVLNLLVQKCSGFICRLHSLKITACQYLGLGRAKVNCSLIKIETS